MKITREEIFKNYHTNNICKIIINSLVKGIVEDGSDFEVNLKVNGVEVEPKLLHLMINHTEEYIEQKAKELIEKQLKEHEEKLKVEYDKALDKLNRFNRVIADAHEDFLSEFGLKED